MFTEEHLYSIALRKCSNLGDISFKKLIKAFGSAENIWKEDKLHLLSIEGINRNAIAEIGNLPNLKFAENEITFCQQNNVSILLKHQSQLPYYLAECIDAPAILYLKGKINPNLQPVSIVGTRNTTTYGKKFVDDFLQKLPQKSTITISGLAHGVDTEVHEKSIENNIPTIAVLAHGFQTLYPAANRKLAQTILDNNGALITEFNSSQKPDRKHFLQRNRIVAGISRNTIIVETAFGGGSISTATFANNYNREVYALPGKITDKHSQGCNHLIFQNKAIVISTIPDLINSLGFKEKQTSMPELFPSSEVKIELSDQQKLVYQTIAENPTISLDDLSEKTELLSYELLPILLELEISKLIKSFSGRKFSTL